jgi:Cd2+/Zn2+-exporting ATPase/Cu+-exporting ATPase
MAEVKLKQLFATVYNSVGLPLAAWSFLPPILTAAVQSIPDLIILRNSPVCSDNKD